MLKGINNNGRSKKLKVSFQNVLIKLIRQVLLIIFDTTHTGFKREQTQSLINYI